MVYLLVHCDKLLEIINLEGGKLFWLMVSEISAYDRIAVLLLGMGKAAHDGGSK
jgi:hypothetical protein